MKSVKITSLTEIPPFPHVYIEGTVGGVPCKGSILRATLDALPNKQARMRALAEALSDDDDEKKRGRFGDLLGDIEVEERAPKEGKGK